MINFILNHRKQIIVVDVLVTFVLPICLAVLKVVGVISVSWLVVVAPFIISVIGEAIVLFYYIRR